MFTVYSIENTVSGRIYVGVTFSFRVRRRQHLNLLRKGKHCNKHLQGAFNKYGEKALRFDVLEEFTAKADAIEGENFYIAYLPFLGFNLYNQKNGSGIGMFSNLTPRPPSSRKIDLTGKVFGCWTVLSEAGKDKTKLLWLCKCLCGTTRTVRGESLYNGHTTSCGCVSSNATAKRNFKHGQSRSKEHKAWTDMLQRCQNPNDSSFGNYGGRGIAVCNCWQDFSNFLQDMGPIPASKPVLSRIDTNGNYEPGNCRWATRLTLGNNTRRNHTLTINGETKNVSQWAEEKGINYHTLQSRLRYGWVGERLFAPIRK